MAHSSTKFKFGDSEFSTSTTARRLEEWIERSVTAVKKKSSVQDEIDESKKEEDEDGFVRGNPIQLFTSEDGYLLRCKRTRATIEYQAECLAAMVAKEEGVFVESPKEPPRTVLGVLENQELLHSTVRDDVEVHVEVFRPGAVDTSHVLEVARGDWTRRPLFASSSQPTNTGTVGKTVVRFVDLTTFQENRDSEDAVCRLDSPGSVFRLLRSILVQHSCSPENIHWASPWTNNFIQETDVDPDPTAPRTVSSAPRDDVIICLAVMQPAESRNGVDNLEAREFNELAKFRTGDAAPAYYMHSRIHMDNGLSWHDLVSSAGDNVSDICHPTTVFVFRPLPPREHISLHHPKVVTKATEGGIGKPYLGCLWETHLCSAPASGDSEGEKEKDEQQQAHDPWKDGPRPDVVTRYRLLSPPYMNYRDIYPPRLFEPLLEPDNFRRMREEALQIPQWTDWPETTHYDTSENAIWTVFPLCHTFPSNDVTKRKFIDQTCSFVPHTMSVLKEALGDRLRTALFSRLGPRTELNAHTGWADLANYVLRVHVPLVVPGTGEPESSPSVGLCGTWVDGCVETQEEGRVLVFDDSKLHRAFNYSDEDRIILILDLERPTQEVVKRDAEADGSVIPAGRTLRSLPLGYATGEHTEELDDFINQLT